MLSRAPSHCSTVGDIFGMCVAKNVFAKIDPKDIVHLLRMAGGTESQFVVEGKFIRDSLSTCLKFNIRAKIL